MEDFIRQVLLLSGVQASPEDVAQITEQMAVLMQTIPAVLTYPLAEVPPAITFSAAVRHHGKE
jgi:hypothetical protein